MLYSTDFSWQPAEPAASEAAWLLPRAPGRTPRTGAALRQTYLRSYRFTVRESLRERVRRNLREAGEMGRAALSEIVCRVLEGRIVAAEAFRSLGAKLQAAAVSPARCFLVGKKQRRCCLEE